MTSITWAGPRCVQGLAAILGPQNRTQGRCDYESQQTQFPAAEGLFDLFCCDVAMHDTASLSAVLRS